MNVATSPGRQIASMPQKRPGNSKVFSAEKTRGNGRGLISDQEHSGMK